MAREETREGVKTVGVVAGTVAAVAALFGPLRDWATYLPPHRLWIPALLFAALAAWLCWYRFGDLTWRKRWEATQLQAQQVAINARLGFRPIAHLSTLTGQPISSNSSEAANILQVGPEHVEDGLRYQEVKITEPSGIETEFAYALLYDRSSWVAGSMTEFVGTDGNPVHVETALANAQIRESVIRAGRVMCFGFASSDRLSASPHENEQLSDSRAINLCAALVRLHYVLPRRGQEAIAVGFGEARPQPGSLIDPARERPAIIISIRSSPRRPQAAVFLNAIRFATANSNVAGLDLRNYSRFATRPSGFRIGSADGTYRGYGDASRWVSAGDIYDDRPITPAEPR